MPEYSVYDLERNQVGTINLEPSVFEAPIREHLLYYVTNWQLARRRLGTASTKTRGEVSGGARKPWRQKGTGRARQGSIRAPHWRKGGIVFGPKPKDWSFKLPKKLRRQALITALSQKHASGSISIVKNFDLPEIKTKQVAGFLERFNLRKALIVIDGDNDRLVKSARNIKEVKVIKREGLNVFDILKYDSLVLTEGSAISIQEGLRS